MTQQKFCQGCSRQHDCQRIYQQLANIQGPSFVVKVIFAFLLPLLVFIGCLSAFQGILGVIIVSEWLQVSISLLLAVLVTLSSILIIRAVSRQSSKNR